MRKRSVVGLAGLLVVTAPACHHENVGLHVVTHAPEGQARDAVRELLVTFDRPMVADAEVGKELDAGPIVLTPPATAKFRWTDRQTLVLRAARPLPRSTRYQARLATNLKALDGTVVGTPVEWSFTTERLAVTDLSPDDEGRLWVPPLPQLTLAFSQPVHPADVAEHCLFTPSNGSSVPAHLTDREEKEEKEKEDQKEPADSKEPAKTDSGATSVTLQPAKKLERATTYRLECDAALHGTEGPLGMNERYSAELHTYGDLQVVAATPNGSQVNADDLDVKIQLSNPVDAAELARAISINPPLPGFSGRWSDDGGGVKYSARLDLEAGTTYTVKLDGLTDRFHQKLAPGWELRFTTGDAEPHIKIQSGVHSVEAAHPLYPFWTRNITHLEVSVTRLPEDKLGASLRSALSGGYGDEGEEGSDAERYVRVTKKLGLSLRKTSVKIGGTRNKWVDGGLELARLAGGESPTGVFAVEVASSEEGVPRGGRKTSYDSSSRFIANVTNLGLVAKIGATSGLVWAVHLSDGKPAAGVKLSIRDSQNKVRFSGTTGDDGTAMVPGGPTLAGASTTAAKLRSDEEYGEENTDRPTNLLVIAHEGADLAVLSDDWRDGIEAWSFNLPSNAAPTGRIRGFIQTDRGLYRPGELVHLKGLARSVVGAEGFRVPTEKQVQLVIRDPHGDEALSRRLTLSAFGGFAVDLPLGTEARLGDWQVEARLGKGSGESVFSDRFSVEEYRPATFEVGLKPRKPSYVLGERVRVDLAASFLYGAPMSGGKANFSVRRRDHIASFADYPGFSFSDMAALDETGYWWARYGEQRSYSFDVAEEEAQLDARGRATLRFPTVDPQNEIKTAQDYLISATVTDESNQTISRELAVTVHKSPFYLGVKPSEYVPAAGKPFVLKALAVDTAGKPRAAEAELVVARHEYHCAWSSGAGAGGYGSYHCDEKNTELERRKVSLPAGGVTDLQVSVAEPGTIYLSLRSPDGKGHEVVASDEVWVYGRGDAPWRMSDDTRIPLIASQPRYRPGDTARLVAQAPLSGATALVTVERDGILSHWVQPFASSGDAIQLPVSDKLAPNVFASVVLVRGRTGEGEAQRPVFRMGMTNLEVDATTKKLAIKVSTDRPSYRPGDPVKAKVSVTSSNGTPVIAEVALAAADEGVLQLIGYQTPDPAKRFYAPFALAVSTSTSWNRLVRRTDPNEDADGEGGDSGETSGHVRSKFVSTAFWAPSLVTGADGTVEASFTAPDNLTAFRLMAVAADAGDRFGSGEVRMTVAKPLAALPALPRFFTVGDHLQAGVVVHNHTGASGKVSVEAEASGIKLAGARSQEVTIPAGGNKPVLFDLEATRTGTARLSFKARLGDENDTVVVSLPVERPLEESALLVGEGEAAAGMPAHLKVGLPQGAVADVGGLEVVLDASGLGGIDEGLRYLVEYPYGCLEQTTSKVIPMAKVEDLARSLDLPGLRGAELRGFVEAGVAKILRHQHDDGAFSLWPGSTTEPFLTAFGLYGLTTVKRAGYAVDPQVIQRGMAALAEGIGKTDMGHSDNPLGEMGSRAFALFVLADNGKPDAGAMARLFEERAGVPVFGKAFLARAMAKARAAPESVKTLLDEVMAHAEPVAGSADAVRVTDPGQQHLWWYMSSDTRTTALALSLLLEAAPDHPMVPKLARGLLAAREGGRWQNTQDNLFSLVALADYARARNARAAGSQVLVTLDGKKLFQGSISAGGAGGAGRLALRRARVPLSDLADAKEGTLVITPTGGPVNYNVRVRYARSLEKATADDSGFRIDRTLENPTSGETMKTIHAGEMVKVVLLVSSPVERRRIALVDHLPAGLEPVNPKLRHGDDDTADADRKRDSDWQWQAIEMHDDRVAVFADNLGYHNRLEFSYLARATSAGQFVLPAATVEEMYQPEHRGRTAAEVLTIVGH